MASRIRKRDRIIEFVSGVLEQRGYIYIQASQFYPAHSLEQPIFTRQCEVGKDLYGKRRRVDVALYHPTLHPTALVVQCIWQQSKGSVHEKYPFEVLSIAQNQFDTIIVLDGEGYAPGAKLWLINQAGKNRLLEVFTQQEFSQHVEFGRL